MEFHELLRKMVTERASDLFVKVGGPPCLRIDGSIHFLDTDEISPQDTQEIFEIVEDARRDPLPREPEIDTAYEVPGLGRFRVNIFRQRGQMGFVFRHIVSSIPTFKELSLPEEIMARLSNQQRGLVLVTGNTGSGKSTTLAAMINHINMTRNRHIITIEDPIEFIFKDRKSIIDQREVGIDTAGFLAALKSSVRQSPDVILIGEMRDQETMEAAISAAETGHLVLSTLHTVNATQTVERIINYFPPHQHNLIRMQLSMVLYGVVSQRLIPRKHGKGRTPALETMINSPTIRDLLLNGRTPELYRAIKDGDYFGCQTFNESLKRLYQSDSISLEEAMLAADQPEELKLELKGVYKGAIPADFNFNY